MKDDLTALIHELDGLIADAAFPLRRRAPPFTAGLHRVRDKLADLAALLPVAADCVPVPDAELPQELPRAPRNPKAVEIVTRVVSTQLIIPDTESIVFGINQQLTELGSDSLDHVEIIMSIEDELHIEIPDDEAEAIKTVDDLYDLAAKTLADHV